MQIKVKVVNHLKISNNKFINCNVNSKVTKKIWEKNKKNLQEDKLSGEVNKKNWLKDNNLL